jgi:RNA polymerase sigma-70 factor (ECF subfamily)
MTVRLATGAPGKAKDNLAHMLDRVAANDSGAFAALYKQTSARLYGSVLLLLPGADAGDVLQEAYIRIWERAGEFDPLRGSASAWMATICRNCAIDQLRRVRPTSLEELPESLEPPIEVDPRAARERSEALAALVGCLEELDEEKRSVVLLAYYRGLSRAALGKRFKRPVPTIKTWLRHSLAQLRDCLISSDRNADGRDAQSTERCRDPWGSEGGPFETQEHSPP